MHPAISGVLETVRFGLYDDFSWGRATFLHSRSYGAMGLIWSGSSVDETVMFLLLLSSTYTVSRTFLPLVLPLQWGEGVAQGVERGHSQDSQLIQGIFHKIWHCAGYIKQGKERGRSDGVRTPKSPLHTTEPCFPGAGDSCFLLNAE